MLLRGAVKRACEELKADILLLNAPMSPGASGLLRSQIEAKEPQQQRVVVLLVTSGGLADEAYRCARLLQDVYECVTVCVPGWCKSAGTLLAIAANDLIIGPRGELGPLDVQITKRDELFDRDSGLISSAALDRLREEAFGFFEQFMLQIIAKSQNAVTFRTAADIASNMTVGALAPIFDKVDPLRLGADARAMEIGSAYAQRLNLGAENLKSAEALNMLLNGYPSHSFVIDYQEAEELFTRVQPLQGSLYEVVSLLGALATAPRDEAVILFLDGADDGNAHAEEPNAGEAAEAAAGPGSAESEQQLATEILRATLQGGVGSGRARHSRRGRRAARVTASAEG